MQELIKIFKQNDKDLVSGRDLHHILQIKTPYMKWFNRMLEFGFVDSQDFVTVGQKCLIANGGYQEIGDHAITLDMAKELCMTQKNDIGKMVRRYFIERDKKLTQIENDIRKQINNGAIHGCQGKEYKRYPHAYVDELMYKNSVLGGKEAYELANIIYECGVADGERHR